MSSSSNNVYLFIELDEWEDRVAKQNHQLDRIIEDVVALTATMEALSPWGWPNGGVVFLEAKGLKFDPPPIPLGVCRLLHRGGVYPVRTTVVAAAHTWLAKCGLPPLCLQAITQERGLPSAHLTCQGEGFAGYYTRAAGFVQCAPDLPSVVNPPLCGLQAITQVATAG
ncbi:Disease resistance protein family [Perilla frutescens var. frutescens]|nr:Disease resistance protein family [Perilla frutescens var. frutescens]